MGVAGRGRSRLGGFPLAESRFLAAALCGSAQGKLLGTKTKERGQGCFLKCKELEKGMKKGMIKAHLLIQSSGLPCFNEQRTISQPEVSKVTEGLPDANCLGHHHPGLGVSRPFFPRSSDASGNPRMRIKGKWTLALGMDWVACLHVAYLICSHSNLQGKEAQGYCLLLTNEETKVHGTHGPTTNS